MDRKWALRVLVVLAMLLLAGCAAEANPQQNTPGSDGDVAGFWLGLWHGVIVPVTFVISLFSDTVELYEVHNNGNFYNFGFVLGISVTWGGGGTAGASKARR